MRTTCFCGFGGGVGYTPQIPYPPVYPTSDILPSPRTLPPGFPTPRYLPPKDMGLEIPYPLGRTWDQRYPTPRKDIGPEIPLPSGKDMGPEIPYPLVSRMKTLPSRAVKILKFISEFEQCAMSM